MKTATVTDFRQRMKKLLTAVKNDMDILVLSGPKDMNFVVMTLDRYNSMEETAYLLSTPANTKWLMDSIAEDKAGKTVVKELGLIEPKLLVVTRSHKRTKRAVPKRQRGK